MQITIELPDPKFEVGQKVRLPDDWQKVAIEGKVTERLFQNAQIHTDGHVSIGFWSYCAENILGQDDWYEENALSDWSPG